MFLLILVLIVDILELGLVDSVMIIVALVMTYTGSWKVIVRVVADVLIAVVILISIIVIKVIKVIHIDITFIVVFIVIDNILVTLLYHISSPYSIIIFLLLFL